MYYCIMLVPEPGGGGAGGTCPRPPRRGRDECPKKSRVFICTVMVWWRLGCFGRFGEFWGGLGCFEAVGLLKKKFRALYAR